MFESYIRGVFYYNYSSCHQLHTVALSFLPYAAGKQQLDGKMPKIRHFHFNNCSQRDKSPAALRHPRGTAAAVVRENMPPARFLIRPTVQQALIGNNKAMQKPGEPLLSVYNEKPPALRVVFF